MTKNPWKFEKGQILVPTAATMSSPYYGAWKDIRHVIVERRVANVNAFSRRPDSYKLKVVSKKGIESSSTLPAPFVEGNFSEEFHSCERCGKQLDTAKMKWLELNNRTNLYSDPDVKALPEADSQGCFTFGTDCARIVLEAGGKLTRTF